MPGCVRRVDVASDQVMGVCTAGSEFGDSERLKWEKQARLHELWCSGLLYALIQSVDRSLSP